MEEYGFFLYLDSMNLDLVNEDKTKLSSKTAGNVIYIYIKVRNNTDVNGCFFKGQKKNSVILWYGSIVVHLWTQWFPCDIFCSN